MVAPGRLPACVAASFLDRSGPHSRRVGLPGGCAVFSSNPSKAGAYWCGSPGPLPSWVGGPVAILGSSIAFLFFMVPLPYRMSHWLSGPLQRAATLISCWVLQSLGQPALAEGNTILLGEHHLEVEEACSGLRIFMGILAIAFAYIIATRRRWWEQLLILASAFPSR